MPNLVGTGLNQVPTNGMLGGLAYQNPEHASIKNLDLKNLSQINSEIADTLLMSLCMILVRILMVVLGEREISTPLGKIGRAHV